MIFFLVSLQLCARLPDGCQRNCFFGRFGLDCWRMLRNFTLFRSTLWLALAISLLAFVAVQAWNSDYVLELSIFTDRGDKFDIYVDLAEREFRNLRNDTNNEIQPYLIEARRQYAEDIGYKSVIYGEENYKMIAVKRYSFVVKDKSSGRVLLSK